MRSMYAVKIAAMRREWADSTEDADPVVFQQVRGRMTYR